MTILFGLLIMKIISRSILISYLKLFWNLFLYNCLFHKRMKHLVLNLFFLFRFTKQQFSARLFFRKKLTQTPRYCFSNIIRLSISLSLCSARTYNWIRLCLYELNSHFNSIPTQTSVSSSTFSVIHHWCFIYQIVFHFIKSQKPFW